MDLREWLFRKRMTVRAFSKIIKYQETYISGYLNGKRKPGKKFFEAVKEATNGEVTFEEENQIQDELKR